MADAQLTSPESTVASGDPGDETANRYRYQWTWAAIVCCILLDDTEDVEEILCEHHEDVLLKHRDGTFSGHQVKTRRDDQPPWRTRDKEVITACVRFAKLEAAFPGKFRGFSFLTNHPLHSAANGQDLSHVLRSIKKAPTTADLPSPIARLIKRVARDSELAEPVVVAALSKTVAKSRLPKLRDVTMRLVDAIAQCWLPAADCSYEAVTRAAQSLIEECGRASSLHHEQLLPAYIAASADLDAEMKARIDGKRMTVSRVLTCLEQGRDSAATLAGDLNLVVKPGEGSTELLHQKLDAAGFSVVSRNSAVDLRDKADYLGIAWISKHGHEKGLRRYDHIRSLVLSDAGRAFDATQTEADGFGPAMREDLRGRFLNRRKAGEELFDCTDDHLEGIAFSLTAQCKVVWSNARPWESQ